MVIAELKGGLGNQLFQYAAGLSLAKNINSEFKIDNSRYQGGSVRGETLRNFEIDDFLITASIASGDEIKLLKYPYGYFSKIAEVVRKKVFKRYHVDWNPNFFRVSGSVYLDGYYQSECHFKAIKQEIFSEFQLKECFRVGIKNIVEIIRSTTNPISMHIRRGDYITNPRANKIHDVCTKNYFYNGLDYLRSRLDGSRVFVFSDDIDWVKAEMDLPKSTMYVSQLRQISGDHLRSSQEIYLMSLCQHNIISNSSFSWWGAYLNKFADKTIIAPNVWSRSKLIRHKNILPDGWIGLPVGG